MNRLVLWLGVGSMGGLALLCVVVVTLGVLLFEVDDEGPPPATIQLLDVYSGREEPEPGFRLPTLAAEVPTQRPSETPIPLSDLLAEIDGLSLVRVINQTQTETELILFLEVDVLAGYNTQKTAVAVRDTTFDYFSTEDISFSVVLWDRRNAAVNYTWDSAEREWLTTTLTNNPG